MRVPYVKKHLPSTSKKRPGFKLAPIFLTIHSTANENSTAQDERDWLENPINDDGTGWHICVDENQAIEAVPLDEVAWHAGDGTNGIGNRYSVSLEICESGNRGQTLANAAVLAADLLKKLNLPFASLRQHYDWSGKNCPRILRISNLWAGFLSDVKMMLKDSAPLWRWDIVNEAMDEGLILEKHHPDEVAEKWFVLAVALNLAKQLKAGE